MFPRLVKIWRPFQLSAMWDQVRQLKELGFSAAPIDIDGSGAQEDEAREKDERCKIVFGWFQQSIDPL